MSSETKCYQSRRTESPFGTCEPGSKKKGSCVVFKSFNNTSHNQLFIPLCSIVPVSDMRAL